MLVIHITADNEAERVAANVLARKIKDSAGPKRKARVLVWDPKKTPTLEAIHAARDNGVETMIYVMVRT